MTDRLFVYGTLRAGAHRMHAVLARGATLLGHARVRGLLVDLGTYPGFVETAENRWVTGELWRLHDPSLFARLDAYEGDEYERRLQEVHPSTGPSLTAWVYVYRGPVDLHAIVEHGDWLAHLRRD